MASTISSHASRVKIYRGNARVHDRVTGCLVGSACLACNHPPSAPTHKNDFPPSDSATEQLAVDATQHIDEGVILGKYLGFLTLEWPRQQRTRQREYRLVMHDATKDCGRWKSCIDAEAFGSLMRFANHSCTPDCQFTELGNRLELTVAVSTIRAIEAGEEVTVGYGTELWFICRCGSRSCTHRHIQHREDPSVM